MSAIEQWVKQFRGFGAQPSPERYTELFDLEGTVFDSGMERPLKVTEMAPHMEGILKQYLLRYRQTQRHGKTIARIFTKEERYGNHRSLCSVCHGL